MVKRERDIVFFILCLRFVCCRLRCCCSYDIMVRFPLARDVVGVLLLFFFVSLGWVLGSFVVVVAGFFLSL